jgi:hypothetical protein
LTELKLTLIRIKIVTPDRIQALHIVKALTPLMADLTLSNPEAWLDVHVCPEEPEEEGER